MKIELTADELIDLTIALIEARCGVRDNIEQARTQANISLIAKLDAQLGRYRDLATTIANQTNSLYYY